MGVSKVRTKQSGRGISLQRRDVSSSAPASTRQPPFLNHGSVPELNSSTILEDAIREVRDVWFVKFGVGIVGRYLYATTVTKVRALPRAWHNICLFVRHVVTTLGIILFDDLEAAGAALRAMRFAPFFYLDVGPLGTLYIGMPGALAPNAPSIGAIRTLHHGVAVSRQINE